MNENEVLVKMERRVKGNFHARCGPGEKPEKWTKIELPYIESSTQQNRLGYYFRLGDGNSG